MANAFRQGANNCQVFSRLAWRKRRPLRLLDSAFGVHVGAGFFSVGSAGQDHISRGGPGVAVVSLIDDERVCQTLQV